MAPIDCRGQTGSISGLGVIRRALRASIVASLRDGSPRPEARADAREPVAKSSDGPRARRPTGVGRAAMMGSRGAGEGVCWGWELGEGKMRMLCVVPRAQVRFFKSA